MASSQCESCRWMREVRTARSRFVLCERSRTDARFPKYPPQPVAACSGFERIDPDDEPAPGKPVGGSPAEG